MRETASGSFLQTVRRDQLGDPLEEGPVLVAERCRPIGVDVDLADDATVVGDRDDDLRAGREEAREIARVGVDVVVDLGLPARRGGAADALADRDAYVLGRLG